MCSKKNWQIKEKNVVFGGRLGEYKYYDMDITVKSALEKVKQYLQ